MGAVAAVFRAAARLDTEQRAELQFIRGMVSKMHASRFVEQFEEGKIMKCANFCERICMHFNF